MKTRSDAELEKYDKWQIVPKLKVGENDFDYHSAIKDLKKNYTNPKSPISFSGVNKIFNYYNKTIPIKEIQKFLISHNFYSLHAKSFKKRTNPSFIKYKGQQFQIDLIDVSNLERNNAGIKFLLSVICSFTKKAWIYPLKSKNSRDVLLAFKNILKKIVKPPNSILSDSGSEFRNKDFLKFCEEKNIKTYEAFSSFHGAIVERFNQTIKNRIYKWMDHYKTERYLPYLQDILLGYNKVIHSSTGVSPNFAWDNKSIHPQIREKLQLYYNKIKKKKPFFKSGDVVRIKSLSNSAFTKGYEIQNNQELFTVHSVTTHFPIPMYELKSLESGDKDIIKGKFYGHELVKVGPEVYKDNIL